MLSMRMMEGHVGSALSNRLLQNVMMSSIALMSKYSTLQRPSSSKSLNLANLLSVMPDVQLIRRTFTGTPPFLPLCIFTNYYP